MNPSARMFQCARCHCQVIIHDLHQIVAVRRFQWFQSPVINCTGNPMNQLTRYHVDCIVCSGMGRRAIEALNTEGIKIYQADSERVGDVIESVKSQKLIEIDPAKACQGQGQRGGCAHGMSAPGQGRGAGFGLGPGRGQGRRDR